MELRGPRRDDVVVGGDDAANDVGFGGRQDGVGRQWPEGGIGENGRDERAAFRRDGIPSAMPSTGPIRARGCPTDAALPRRT